MRRHSTILAFAFALLVTACGDQADPNDRLNIVVTTNILGDVVSNVAGDDASVEVLMPVGVDAHDFQASSAQVARIREADLVVAIGLGLEEGLESILAAAASDGVRVLEVAPLLDPIPASSGTDDHDDDDEPDDAHDDEHDVDPHVWMDPIRMADAARLIADRLKNIDPGFDWEGRAEAYALELLEANTQIEALLATVAPADRMMVTNHGSFGYFAARYGWEIVGTVIPGGSSLADPSSAELAELVETINDLGVRAIFVETSGPDTLARVVAEVVGEQVEVVELHTESLGEPGSEAGTLIGMLLENARRITDSLTRSG